MSVLNFQKYKFVVSYDKKTESRLGVIIQTYESVFLKYIKFITWLLSRTKITL